jgi:hypothetical protein
MMSQSVINYILIWYNSGEELVNDTSKPVKHAHSLFPGILHWVTELQTTDGLHNKSTDFSAAGGEDTETARCPK